MNIEQQRADFEAWAKDGFHLQRGLNGDYRATITQIAWACWQEAYQAAMQSSEAQTPGKDAARYRFLRDIAKLEPHDIFNAWWLSDNRYPQTLDAAIDAAMDKQKW